MKPYKSSSTLSNAVAALMLLSATGSFVRADEVATPHETLSVLGGKGEVALAEIAKSSTGDDKTRLFSITKKTFAYYCENGKQTRAIERSLLLPIPKLPPGTALDEYAEFKKSYQEKANKELVKAFFYNTMFDGDLKKWAPIERPNFYYSTSSEVPVHVKALLDRSADYGAFWGDIRNTTRMPESPIPIPKMVYFQAGNSSPVFVLPASEMKKVNYDATASTFESNFFGQYFTMMIPEKVQDKIWKLRDYDGVIQAYGYKRPTYNLDASLANRPKATLSAKAAIEDRADLWKAYLKKFTTVKESPSDSPDVIRYQAVLDLNLFCQYGRFIGDLMAF